MKSNKEMDRRNMDKKVKDRNYAQLIKYLRENEIVTKKNEFRAILFAMNGMTIYFETKAQAIKRSSDNFEVTQKFIKEHLDEMGIQSERLMENKKQFGKTQGLAIGLLKSKMATAD